MATCGLAGSPDKQAAVVLVSCVGGSELVVVRDALTRSLQTPAVLVTHADLGSTPISLDLTTGLLAVGGWLVRPAVVWVRHSSACALVAQARPAGSLRPLDAASWSTLLKHVAASTPAALPGTAPVGTGQLVDASRLGVKAPRTVVTTDVNAGIRQIAAPRVVVKTPDFRLFEPDKRNWSRCLPAIVDGDGGPSDRAGGERPFVVQEYVDHSRELRVYYLNGGICAFDVRKPEPSSLWTDPESVSVTRADCPRAAEQVVRTLCAAWNLRYGAFDLLVSRTGELVFLEANPDGDWLWYERKARWHGVSFMAAVMVRELFVRVTSLGARSDECDARRAGLRQRHAADGHAGQRPYHRPRSPRAETEQTHRRRRDQHPAREVQVPEPSGTCGLLLRPQTSAGRHLAAALRRCRIAPARSPHSVW